MLEVLNHNGVISPSDLQEGAETLWDVTCDSDVNDMLCYYSMMQEFQLQDIVYHEYFCSHDVTEQCQDLIKHGQEANETGKYFFIEFRGKGINHHAVAGIGMAEGNWTFNGKNYDKCILTLDSNLADENDSTKSAGFAPENCIYVNSEKNEFYFPAYESDSANEDTFITYITFDTDVLNNQGYLNPTEYYNPEYDKLKNIVINAITFDIYDISVEVDGKTETYTGYPGKHLENFTKNTWSSDFSEIGYFREAESITAEMTGDYQGSQDSQCIRILTWDAKNCFEDIGISGKARCKIENHGFSYTNLDNKENSVNFDSYVDDREFPYKRTGISAKTDINESLNMELCEDGVIFTTDSDSIKVNVDLGKNDYDEKGNYIGTHITFDLYSLNDVKIKCKENSDEVYFAIGENFDIPVETGDVNCDGKIDSSDASLILSDYALVATGEHSKITAQLADYNKDSAVDASDASAVLALYAELSTSASA